MSRRSEHRAAIGVATLVLAALASGPALSYSNARNVARSAGSCQQKYADWGVPIYFRVVNVSRDRRLTCSDAAFVGSAVATYYEHGLPIADYPRHCGGCFPGGKGRPFAVPTKLGRFVCHMLSRGSDFVVARCSRDAMVVSFGSENHYGPRPTGNAPPNTSACPASARGPGIRLLAVEGVDCRSAARVITARNSHGKCSPQSSTYGGCTVHGYWCSNMAVRRNVVGVCSRPGYADIVFKVRQ